MIQELYNAFIDGSGVITDTRKIKEGCLFFCLKGANFDGNTFAKEAIEKGASYAVIDNSEFAIPGKTILVNDTLRALQDLAHHHRMQFSIPVLGITGSNGKTTSKELIAAVLSTEKHILFTEGNLNNHIGVPLTLLHLNETHELAIIEMGANKPGDIQELVYIAAPTHGIITNIGRAHLEGFGSLEGVIQTKTEMYRYLASHNGHFFIHAADEILLKNLPKISEVSSYGKGGSIDGKLIRLSPFVEMQWTEGSYCSDVIKTQLIGEYNYVNFLAAICIGRHFGISRENCSKAIQEYTPTNNRSQVTKTAKNTLIVDCYNANPTSMHPQHLFLATGYDESLSHRIQAASDYYLMPSLFEPCGLTQLFAMAYGTIPIVRSVGGLADTVEEYDPVSMRGTGFRFGPFTADALSTAIERALHVYRREPHWTTLRQQAMARDYSIERTARHYVDVFSWAAPPQS